MDFNAHLAIQKKQIDEFINQYVGSLEESLARPGLSKIYEALRYALVEGGGRVRPLLSMLTAESLGHVASATLPFGVAIEFIHTYSLVHDDLPCMDNDDFRRGKPSVHKKFGEAFAVLVGDCLNTEAFQLLAHSYSSNSKLALELIGDLALASGPQGMVGGQAIDVELKGRSSNPAEIEFLHLYKTGALFKAAIIGAARVCNANAIELKSLSDFSRAFGLMYQIVDDIGDGHKIGEPSFVGAVGVENAKSTCVQLLSQANLALESFGQNADGLKNFATQLLERVKN